jgi:hypothetical protein
MMFTFGPQTGRTTWAFKCLAAEPQYTDEESDAVKEAQDVLQRAFEGGHFHDLERGENSVEPMLARLHKIADRASDLLRDMDSTIAVVCVARETTLGPALLVGIRGRI